MKTENLSIGLRVLYHAIEWLTVFLILLIFAVQIITPLYAVRVGRADSFLQQLQWLPNGQKRLSYLPLYHDSPYQTDCA